MRSCAAESPSAMRTHSSSWWTAIRGARTGSLRQSSATRPTLATSRRTRLSGCTNRPGRFDGRSRFSTWFYRILVNLCIDHQRKNRWWKRLAPLATPGGDDPDERAFDPPSSEAGPEDEAMLTQSIRRLRPALAKLSPQQRAAVLLQTQEGFSSREIGEVLKCSEATARVHVHRGIAQLRKLMAND